MLNKAQAAAIIEKLTTRTTYAAAVNIRSLDESVTRFANSEISQNVSTDDTKISLTLYDGKKEASCTTNVLSDDGLEKLVRDAEAILSVAPEGPFEKMPSDTQPVPETVNDDRLADAFGIAERAAKIKAGVQAITGDYTAAGALTLARNAIACGGSDGVFRFAAFDDVQFNTVITHADGAAGSGEAIGYRLEDLNIAAAFTQAQQRAQMARHPRSVDLGSYTVILSPVALGDLFMFVSMPLCAKWIDDGDSFAIGKLNQPVFGKNITLTDDVNHPETQPLFFDYEGSRRQPVTLIENGIVKALLHDHKTARRQGTVTTGHAVSRMGYGGYPQNLILSGGNHTLEEMIRETKRGIFIAEFHYTNYVNPRTLQITGLTRNGTFMIEDGAITHAITTMRFTQDVMAALNAVTALSQSLTRVNANGTVALMPAAKIEGFQFTSKP